MGSIALAYFDPRLRGVVLSGAGGGISLSVVGRDAGDFDIQGLLEDVAGFAPGETLDTFHPIVGLLQLLGEASDPLSYARHWFHAKPRWDAGPTSVLMFEGDADVYTPPDAIEALAAAARVPLLDEAVRTTGALALPSTPTGTTPTSQNTAAWDGTRVSSGLMQFSEGGHFVIFQEDVARDAYVHFLETAMDGTPELRR
jgi:hypothetical protein